MEGGDDSSLQIGLQIDQEVAATDQVHAREGRIAHEIVPREDDLLAQRLDHAIAAFFLDEETPQPFGRDILRECPWHRARAGLCRAAPRSDRSRKSGASAHARRFPKIRRTRSRSNTPPGRWNSRAPRRATAHRARAQARSLGKTLPSSASNASGLRKKLVTLMSTSE